MSVIENSTKSKFKRALSCSNSFSTDYFEYLQAVGLPCNWQPVESQTPTSHRLQPPFFVKMLMKWTAENKKRKMKKKWRRETVDCRIGTKNWERRSWNWICWLKMGEHWKSLLLETKKRDRWFSDTWVELEKKKKKKLPNFLLVHCLFSNRDLNGKVLALEERVCNSERHRHWHLLWRGNGSRRFYLTRKSLMAENVGKLSNHWNGVCVYRVSTLSPFV